MTRRAILTVVSGPNTGDSLTIEMGTCRLVGRHLSESETAMMDREGNRLLDAVHHCDALRVGDCGVIRAKHLARSDDH